MKIIFNKVFFSGRLGVDKEDYRPDIDGLRALAVILVIIYHYFPRLIPGGYIGVDIFFVISGYLITKIIFSEIKNGSFSFVNFYARRANRIFPALIVVLLFCLVFGWLALYSDEYHNLGEQIASGAVFLSNFYFYNEVGYWDKLSILKPLLHLWSLGIEEQFYLLWPVFLFFLWKFQFKIKIFCFGAILISYSYTIYIESIDPAFAFYLPGTRLWELGSGGLLAVFDIDKNQKKYNKYFFNDFKEKVLVGTLSLFGIFIILYYALYASSIDFTFNVYALYPVFGTIFLISASDNSFFNRFFLSNKFVVYIGLISYPLYLWHWIFISFAYLYFNGDVSSHNKVVIIFVTLVFAIITYHFVEKPLTVFHFDKKRKALLLTLFLGFCGCCGFYISSNNGLSWRYDKNQEEYVFNSINVDFPPSNLALIGDSNAAHLLFGLQKYVGKNIHTELKSGWPFLVGTKYKEGYKPHPRHTGSPELTDSAVDRLIQDKDIRIVIIANRYDFYANNDNLRLVNHDDKTISTKESYKFGLEKTIQTLIKNKKKVIYVMPVPYVNVVSIESCNDLPLPLSRVRPQNCEWKRESVIKNKKYFYSLVDEIKKSYPEVVVIDTLDFLCVDDECSSVKNKRIVYLDQSHLNDRGSLLIAKRFLPYLN